MLWVRNLIESHEISSEVGSVTSVYSCMFCTCISSLLVHVHTDMMHPHTLLYCMPELAICTYMYMYMYMYIIYAAYSCTHTHTTPHILAHGCVQFYTDEKFCLSTIGAIRCTPTLFVPNSYYREQTVYPH